MSYFLYKCYTYKKKKGKEEKINVTKETEEESPLMMIICDEFGELLLQGASESYDNRLWYLDTGASSHMTGKKSFFHQINENQKGKVKFGYRSTIPYEGKGNISVTFKTDEVMIILNILYLPNLKTNILSLGKLDDQGFITILSCGFLKVHDKFSRLLTKTKKIARNMYKLKIDINERCNLTQ